MIQCKVNGVERALNGAPETPLLWYLRRTAWSSPGPSTGVASSRRSAIRSTVTRIPTGRNRSVISMTPYARLARPHASCSNARRLSPGMCRPGMPGTAHQVTHAASGRSLGYGELATLAAHSRCRRRQSYGSKRQTSFATLAKAYRSSTSMPCAPARPCMALMPRCRGWSMRRSSAHRSSAAR